MLAAPDDTIDLTAESLRRLYGDWDQRRRGRPMPARADFDAAELRYILGNLSLIDVLRDPVRFRYRVHATNAARRLCFDLTGKELDRLPNPEYREIIRAHLQSVVALGRPVHAHRVHRFSDYRCWKCEVLALPLASDGRQVDMLLSAVVWQESGTD